MSVSPARKKYSIVSSGFTMSAWSPVSSRTSRNAAASDVSPCATAPFGRPHLVRPRVAIMATCAAPLRIEITAPPDEYSLRVFAAGGGIREQF